MDEFAAARNHAFAQATQDWVVWYDADEVIPSESQAAIRALKATVLENVNIDAVFAPYYVLFKEAGEVTQKYDRERFLRRSAGHAWHGAVHEGMPTNPDGVARACDAYVVHDPHPANAPRKVGRNLRVMEKHIGLETPPTRDVYLYGCELSWNNRLVEAAQAFRCFVTREASQFDLLGEQYLSFIKMVDCLNQTRDLDGAMRACRDAIGLDCTRAEAYCLAGRFLMAHGEWKQAWPFLVAASSLPMPVNSPNMIFTWFYDEAPRRDLLTCATHLEERADLAAHLQLLAATTALPRNVAQALTPRTAQDNPHA